MARSRKPAVPRINWAHPLTRGLVWLTTPGVGTPQELVAGGIGTSQGNAKWTGATSYGPAMTNTSSSNGGVWYPWSPALEALSSTDKITIVVLASSSAVEAYSVLFALPYTSDGSDPYEVVEFRRSDTTTACRFMWAWRSLAPGYDLVTSDTGVLDTGPGAHVVAVTRTGSTVRFYRDGIKIGADKTLAESGNFQLPATRQSPMVGNPFKTASGGVQSHKGEIGFVGVWARALTLDEIRRISADPYGILYQRERIILTSAPAGGVDATGTAAADSVPITGVAATGTAGTGATGTASADATPITGVAATATTGTSATGTASADAVPITGVAATADDARAGVGVAAAAAVPVTGVAATATAGTGATGTAAAGAILVTGVAATGTTDFILIPLRLVVISADRPGVRTTSTVVAGSAGTDRGEYRYGVARYGEARSAGLPTAATVVATSDARPRLVATSFPRGLESA